MKNKTIKTNAKKFTLSDLAKMPKPPVVNKNLQKKLEKIISNLVAKEFRKEALNVLLKTDSELLGQFLYYYYSNIGNVACMVIDSAKAKLVKKGKMKQSKTDGFGMPFVEFDKLEKKNEK